MSLRPHGHARVSARHPEAFAKCDRCGFVFNLVDLSYQHEWAGPKLVNERLKVCRPCLDRPQEQLRLVHLTPDPRPVRDPRPLNNAATMGGYAVMQRVAAFGATAGGSTAPNVALQLLLEVTAPPADNSGYPVSPFADFYADTNADAGPDTGVSGFSAIPVSIDPPET